MGKNEQEIKECLILFTLQKYAFDLSLLEGENISAPPSPQLNQDRSFRHQTLHLTGLSLKTHEGRLLVSEVPKAHGAAVMGLLMI